MRVLRDSSGIVWSALNAAAAVMLPFLTFIYFARVAQPQLIGLVALCVSSADVLKTLGAQGLYEALLQQPPDDRRSQETALAVLIGAGVLLGVIYLALIGLFVSLHGQARPEMPALMALGARIPFDLMTIQPQARLARRLSYHRLALRTLFANGGASVLGITTSVLLTPLWGLAVYQIGLSVLLFVFTAFGGDLIARPRFHRDAYRQMAREASWSTSVRFVAATVNNLDQIIVAWIAGSTSLAFFNLGKRIETTCVSIANSFVVTMFQPQFAGDSDEPRFDALRRCMLILTVICGVPVAFVLIKAHFLIRLMFGAKWLPAQTVVRLLAVSGLVRAVGYVPGALMSVSARNHKLFVVSAVSAAGTGLAALALTPSGIAACAAGLVVKNALVLVLIAYLLRDIVPRAMQAYGQAFVLPASVIISGVLLVHWVGIGWVPAGSTIGQVALLAVGGLIGVGASLALAFAGLGRREAAVGD